MTAAELQTLKMEYVVLAQYYQVMLKDAVLLAYVEDLQDMGLDEVLAAMRHLRPSRRTLPLPSDIRQACRPAPAVRASDIAGRIGEAISKFGYTNPRGARDYIGTIGWVVCDRMGGWTHICQTLTADRMGTFHAQCREMARGLIDMDERLLPQVPLLDTDRGRRRPSGLQAASSVLAHMPALAHA